MKTGTKIITSIVAVLLSCILLFVTVIVNNNKTSDNLELSTRTIVLSEAALNDQGIFNEFEDVSLTEKGSVLYFEGYKPLEINQLSEIDYISEDDLDYLEESTIRYNFSYDFESFVITISAEAMLSDGNIEVDEITGVGFMNENNEIDAVMNINGEGILLSEMRDMGLIQNCGWLSSLIKGIATGVAIAATVVAVGAAIVVTAGAAAPAFVAAGITAITAATGATAASLCAASTLLAVIAAGTAMNVDMWQSAYPGINVTISNNIPSARWNDKTKQAIRDITAENKKHGSVKVYFPCDATSCNPINVQFVPVDKAQMAAMMTAAGKSSYTVEEYNATGVLSAAFPTFKFVKEPPKSNRVDHYHVIDPADKNGKAHYKVHGHTIHSFFGEM